MKELSLRIFFFIVVAALLQWICFPFLVSYVEKTSFIWQESGKRKLNPDREIYFFGDSQLMSGVKPDEFSKLTGTAKEKIGFYPLPSDQPERIWLELLTLRKKTSFKNRTFIISVSPITLSKNEVTDAHKSLFHNYHPFLPSIMTEPDIMKFYFKDGAGLVYYLFGRLFPVLRLNGFYSTEIKFLKKEISPENKDFRSALNEGFFSALKKNGEMNHHLEETLLKNDFHWEWGTAKEETECHFRADRNSFVKSSVQILYRERPDSVKTWNKIFDFLQKEEARFLFVRIPFSPMLEDALSEAEAPDVKLFKEWEQKKKGSVFTVDSDDFSIGDFTDLTHLNSCGRKKFQKALKDKIKDF
ncbi:MAG TPA: hypothetical protein PL048_09220 [Leptospiraceae bacterium]|nr:hypothetical protein [Leptospiraceae bacterium]